MARYVSFGVPTCLVWLAFVAVLLHDLRSKTGRMNRATYWLGAVALIVILTILVETEAYRARFPWLYLVAFLFRSRVRDIGRRTQRVIRFIGTGFVLFVFAYAYRQSNDILAFHFIFWSWVLPYIFGMMILLGFIPGDSDANRWGGPPPTGPSFSFWHHASNELIFPGNYRPQPMSDQSATSVRVAKPLPVSRLVPRSLGFGRRGLKD